MAEKPKRLILVSLDGLASSDLATVRDLPNLGALLGAGTCVECVEGVYPTQTYPLHVSLITGTHPQRHNVAANTRFQPGAQHPEWFWFNRDIGAPTLYDVAKSSGRRVVASLWPGAAGAGIDVNLPEILPPRGGRTLPGLVMRNGTPFLILNLLLRFGRHLRGIDRTHLDDFVSAWANCCDGSAHIYLRNKQDKQVHAQMRSILATLQGSDAIKQVFCEKELCHMKIGADIAAVAEASEGYYFSPVLRDQVIETAAADYKATHGYLPTRPGYTSLLLAAGAGIRTGLTLPSLRIIDIGPTLATLLGLSMPNVQGRIAYEMLAG